MAAKPMQWTFIVRTSNVIVQTQHRLTLANGVTMAINSSECCQLDLIHLARMSSAEVTHYTVAIRNQSQVALQEHQ